MTWQRWKSFVLAGLLGLTGLAAGCSERGKAEVREGARQAGQEVGKAAKDVKNAGEGAADGLRQGWGGSGTDKNIGNNNDGQGPLEKHP
jgi:hypothetical protein